VDAIQVLVRPADDIEACRVGKLLQLIQGILEVERAVVAAHLGADQEGTFVVEGIAIGQFA